MEKNNRYLLENNQVGFGSIKTKVGMTKLIDTWMQLNGEFCKAQLHKTIFIFVSLFWDL
jgi:hypothetical protein